MELLDVYTADRQKTGRTMIRGKGYEQDAFIIVVHVCMFHSDGRMLIQQRHNCKKGWPGLWDLSAAGCVMAGEDMQTAAARELQEELGVQLDVTDMRPALTVNFDHGFDDFFLVEKDVEMEEIILQPEEVQKVKWAARDEIKQMIEEGSFVPYYPSLIDYIFDSRSYQGLFRKEQAIVKPDINNIRGRKHEKQYDKI